MHNIHSKDKYVFVGEESALNSWVLKTRKKVQNPKHIFGDNGTTRLKAKFEGERVIGYELNTVDDYKKTGKVMFPFMIITNYYL